MFILQIFQLPHVFCPSRTENLLDVTKDVGTKVHAERNKSTGWPLTQFTLKLQGNINTLRISVFSVTEDADSPQENSGVYSA